MSRWANKHGELHYWNRANFEGLSSLSSALGADPRLERLAAYCDLREKGLRQEAPAQLDVFLTEVASWDEPVQRTLCVYALEMHDPFVGPDILSEAGRNYFVQSYAAIIISSALALGGMIVGWNRKKRQAG